MNELLELRPGAHEEGGVRATGQGGVGRGSSAQGAVENTTRPFVLPHDSAKSDQTGRSRAGISQLAQLFDYVTRDSVERGSSFIAIDGATPPCRALTAVRHA